MERTLAFVTAFCTAALPWCAGCNLSQQAKVDKMPATVLAAGPGAKPKNEPNVRQVAGENPASSSVVLPARHPLPDEVAANSTQPQGNEKTIPTAGSGTTTVLKPDQSATRSLAPPPAFTELPAAKTDWTVSSRAYDSSSPRRADGSNPSAESVGALREISQKFDLVLRELGQMRSTVDDIKRTAGRPLGNDDPSRSFAANAEQARNLATEATALPNAIAPVDPAGKYERIRYKADKPLGGNLAPVESVREPAHLPADDPSRSPTPRSGAELRLRQLAAEIERMQPGPGVDPVRLQLAARTLYALAGDGTMALRTAPGLDAADRRLTQSLLWAQLRYFDDAGEGRPETRASDAALALRDALSLLEQRAPLEITTPVLCKKVVNFGNFDEFERYEFKPGQTVVVYWEVRNFASTEDKDGFRTKLEASFEIYDAKGNLRHRWARNFKDDVCKNRRHDYFNAVVLTLPEDLTAGQHVLKVTARDKANDRVAEKQRRFEVQAKSGS